MKKIPLCLLFSGLLSVSCSSSQTFSVPEGTKIDIVLGSESLLPVAKQTSDDFLKSHGLENKVTVSFIYGEGGIETPFDICYSNSDGLAALRGSDRYLPLSESYARQAKENTAYEDDFIDEGKFMAFPVSTVPYTVLFYDASVFNEDDVSSWKQLLQKAKEKETKVAMFRRSFMDYLGVFRAFGATFDSRVDQRGRITYENDTFDSQNGLDAAKALSTLYANENLVEFNFDTTGISAFESGTYSYDAAKKAYGENLRIAVRPKLERDGKFIDIPTIRDNTCFFVSSTIEESKKELAFGLCAALSSKKTQEQYQKLLGTSFLPSNVEASKLSALGNPPALLKASLLRPSVSVSIYDEAAKLGQAMIDDKGQRNEENLAAALKAFHESVAKIG